MLTPAAATGSGDPASGRHAVTGARALGVYASAIALLAALLFVTRAAIRIFGTGIFADVSRDVLWMSPVSNLVWYGVAWAVFAVAARLVGGERGFEVGVWGLIATFTFSLLLPVTAIHRVAALIFAAGLATALVQVQQRSPQSWFRLARATRNVLAVGFLGANIVMFAGESLATRRAARNLPDARPGSPSVIFLVIDTMRGDVLQSAGYHRRVMPFLDSLAAEGAYFPYAFATTSWTLPSHGSMFTGEYAGRLTTTTTVPLDGSYHTLGEAFAASGFYTVGFTANLHYTSWESGINRGFHEWHDYQRSFRQVLRSSVIGQLQMFIEISDATSWQDVVAALRRHQIMVYPKPEQHAPTATEMTDRFLSWYDRRPTRPFFSFVNYFDAHLPYRPPRDYRTRFTAHPERRDLYDGELAYVDDELRRLFSELRQRGALENTYVVITADHGEHFGGHGELGHGASLYSAVLRVPLVLLGPRISPRRVEHAVSLRDLPGTFVHLAGVSFPFPGVSLTGHLADSSYRSSPVLAQLGTGAEAWQSYTDDEFHLVRRPGGEELYRYRSAPAEANDLARVDSLKPQLLRLRQEMAAAIDAATGSASRGIRARGLPDSGGLHVQRNRPGN